MNTIQCDNNSVNSPVLCELAYEFVSISSENATNVSLFEEFLRKKHHYELKGVFKYTVMQELLENALKDKKEWESS